jgi:hypothetical protein
MLGRFLLIAAALCVVLTPAAMAEMEDSDFGHVDVTILPTVAVTFMSGDILCDEAQALDQICAELIFSVHANGQDIAMMCGASMLFKDNQPGSQFFIPVDDTEEAVITAAYGESHGELPILEDTYGLGGYGNVTVYHTDWMGFGSGDPGTWSYDVTVDICWQGDNAEIFQGNYSGGVVLWAMYVGI